MGDKWVGFRESPKLSSGAPVVITDEWTVAIELPKLVALFTKPEGLGRWLGEVTKLDVRRGGSSKATVGDQSFGFTYSVIDLPKRFVILTERFGQVDAQIQHKAEPVRMTLTLTRYVPESDDRSAVETELREVCALLRQACQ